MFFTTTVRAIYSGAQDETGSECANRFNTFGLKASARQQ
jgi:hypothetical protein